MEQSTPYRVEKNPNSLKPDQILLDPYTQIVKEFMNSLILSGYQYETEDELYAVAADHADTLIRRSEELKNITSLEIKQAGEKL